jgi:hypothetical protein
MKPSSFHDRFPVSWIKALLRAELRRASRYHVDAYGRPRPLSRREVILHGLAWPVMIGVIIGYCVAITVAAVHHVGTVGSQAQTILAPVTNQETES